jgi:hypothetical protein
MVSDGSLREGQTAVLRRGSEESDEGMVPRKSAKTRVTPVESMEGRPEAEGNLIHHSHSDSGPGNVAASCGEGRIARRGGRRNDHRKVHHHRRSSLVALLRRPEVGARCGKSARRALSGGRPEPTDEGQRRAVPTGTVRRSDVS